MISLSTITSNDIAQKPRLRLQGERSLYRGRFSAQSVPGMPVHQVPAGQHETRWYASPQRSLRFHSSKIET